MYTCVGALHVARDSNYGLKMISSICLASNADNNIDDDYYDYCNNISDTAAHTTFYFTVVFVIPPYGFMALCLIYTCVTSSFNLIAL